MDPNVHLQSDLFDIEWALTDLLGMGEVVIQGAHLEDLRQDLNALIDRAKYYGEHTKSLDIFEELRETVKWIQMGARP